MAVDLRDSDMAQGSKTADKDAIGAIRQNLTQEGSIKYEERVVKQFSETLDAVEEFVKCNMVLVGR